MISANSGQSVMRYVPWPAVYFTANERIRLKIKLTPVNNGVSFAGFPDALIYKTYMLADYRLNPQPRRTSLC
jgi:hypothetical protein